MTEKGILSHLRKGDFLSYKDTVVHIYGNQVFYGTEKEEYVCDFKCGDPKDWEIYADYHQVKKKFLEEFHARPWSKAKGIFPDAFLFTFTDLFRILHNNPPGIVILLDEVRENPIIDYLEKWEGVVYANSNIYTDNKVVVRKLDKYDINATHSLEKVTPYNLMRSLTIGTLDEIQKKPYILVITKNEIVYIQKGASRTTFSIPLKNI